MKRILWLLTVMILMSGLIYYLNQHKKDPNASFSRTASNFRIENTNTIGRIVLTNKDGSRSDLKRVGDHWTINDQYKARQTNVDFLLTGIQRQELDHIPNKAADEGILKYMAVAGIHVEIFDLEGKPLLSYTVGGVTQD
ncbi:MAG TPA: hypothetical protein VJ508_07050, partial [Saprospiraceae bacterium]|nr:hypothetical protein [Saprospiraceae bacterium]